MTVQGLLYTRDALRQNKGPHIEAEMFLKCLQKAKLFAGRGLQMVSNERLEFLEYNDMCFNRCETKNLFAVLILAEAIFWRFHKMP